MEYEAKGVIPRHVVFKEMLDVVNRRARSSTAKQPVEFDSMTAAEGICGSCALWSSMAIRPRPGSYRPPPPANWHMRRFQRMEIADRHRTVPCQSVSDRSPGPLTVDRSALSDRIIKCAGGFISNNTGTAQDANSTFPVPKNRDRRCGLCRGHLHRLWRLCGFVQKCQRITLYGCKNFPSGFASAGSARARRARLLKMVAQMDAEQFGSCTNIGSLFGGVSKEISLETIARMNRDHFKAKAARR